MQETIKKDVVYIGRTNFRGTNRLFGIKRKDRRQHMYIIGKTGTGKTALQHNMIIQDIANGEGLCVIDPHGELVETILEKIPNDRVNDVVYFNPADPNHHIGFNPIELPDPKYKNLIASGLMAIFTKIWANVWSPRMEYILNNAILALLDTPNSTLLGVSRILSDKDYRSQVVANVTDPVVKAFWINEFEQWRDQFRMEAIAPIQNKVGQFLSTAMIRNIVGQAKSTIDIFDIMNTRKIFLVNVSKGRIGEDNSALLGAMLITKIQLSAMERVRIPEDERKDFFLYVDEFQNFATDSFAGILSEARKYRLNLIIAHQYIGQLVTDVSTKVRDAVFGNAGTMVMFRVGGADAEYLEKEFTPELLPQDMVNLPNHNIYIKIMVDGITSRPFSAATMDYFKIDTAPDVKKKIYATSQANYARPREVVEREINSWSGIMGDGINEGGGAPQQGQSSASGPSQGQIKVGNTTKFQITCATCGKTAFVPFKPEPGRPVYCGDCMAKIKAGELEPVKIERREKTKGEEYYETLMGLGIEYEGKAPQKPRENIKEKEVPKKKPEEFKKKDTPVVKVDKKEKEVSLKDLTTREDKPKEKEEKQRPPKKEPDIAGLRSALKDALTKVPNE